MERPHAAEAEPGLHIEVGEGKLQGNDDAYEKADHAPEYRGDHAVLHDLVEIFRLSGPATRGSRTEINTAQEHQCAAEQHEEQHPHVRAEKAVLGEACSDQRQEGADGKYDHLDCVFHGWVPTSFLIADGERLRASRQRRSRIAIASAP